MGIRRKLTVAFLALAALLFFSGVVSLFQLRRLGVQTQEIFDTGTRNMELARIVLDAMQQQASGVMSRYMNEPGDLDSLYAATRVTIDRSLDQTAENEEDNEQMRSIIAAKRAYDRTMEDFISGGAHVTGTWYRQVFSPDYSRLNGAVKDYIIYSQQSLRDRSSRMGDTAYRAMMPGILALAVGIVILLIFLFLADHYFARPIADINRSLKGYLSNRIPFSVRMEGTDEVSQIREGIENLIAQFRRKSE